MSNSFLTVEEIAREGLLRLRNNLVMAQLVHRDHSDEFASRGDTIQIKKPATFEAKDFSSSISTQDIVEDKVNVQMDKIADVSVEVESKELTMNINDFGKQVVEGAMVALAQKIDEDIMKLYKGVPYKSGTLGEDIEKVKDLAQARKVLNKNKVPFGNRYAVWCPEAEANLLTLDEIIHAEKSGGTQGLREASMGRVMGFENFMSQNVPEHDPGSWKDQSPKVDSSHSKGATELGVKNLTSGNHEIKVGDVFTIQDTEGVYVVTKGVDSSAASGTTEDIEIYPGLAEDVANEKNITVLDKHDANLAFHRNAFALVNRPMALPLGGAVGEVVSYNGLSIRTTMGYGMSDKKNTISFDVLYGTKVLQPELAVRVGGDS